MIWAVLRIYHVLISDFLQLSELWNAAANDTVGGSGHSSHGRPKSQLKQFAWAGQDKRARTAALAASKCTGLVSSLRLRALSTPDF